MIPKDPAWIEVAANTCVLLFYATVAVVSLVTTVYVFARHHSEEN